MTLKSIVAASGLLLLSGCFNSFGNDGFSLTIHGLIARTPPAAGSVATVCVDGRAGEGFVGGEEYGAHWCGEGTTNDHGQFTATVLIPNNWHSVGPDTVVCIGYPYDTSGPCWYGTVQLPDDAGTVAVAVVYQ
jgi:hypothetical protein